MKKRLLATALVFGVLGGVWALPIEPEEAGVNADVDLVLRCVWPLTRAQTRPVAVPSECDVFSWTNLRPAVGWQRGLPLPPGRRGQGAPPPMPPTPVPLPLWIYTLSHIA